MSLAVDSKLKVTVGVLTTLVGAGFATAVARERILSEAHADAREAQAQTLRAYISRDELYSQWEARFNRLERKMDVVLDRMNRGPLRLDSR